jgi:hypothetical protein
MTVEALRRIAAVHGALAWLSAALLAIAAVFLARRKIGGLRGLSLTIAATATALITASSALGMLLHEPYQRRLRQRIFIQSAPLGWLFERKEHLAFGALCLAWCALVAFVALSLRERRLARAGALLDSDSPDPALQHLGAAAVRAYAAAALLAAAACVASAVVGRRFTF